MFDRSGWTRAPLVLIALAAVVVLVVLLPPAYLGLRAAGTGGAWEILGREPTVLAMGRTLLLTAAVTATCIALAVPLGWLTARTDLPLRGLWTVLLTLPLAVPSFVGGFVMVSALGPGGMLQDALEPFGVERLPSIYGFVGAWFVLSILSYPYVFLQVRASLARSDPAMAEVARSLGKGRLETLLRVDLPLLRPAISAGGLLVALYVISEFGAVSILRYDTLTPLVYIQYATSFDRGAAAVVGLPLIVLAVLIVSIDGITRGRARYYARGQRGSAPPTRLGAWRWPAAGVCALVALAGVGIPVFVVGYWLLRGLPEGAAIGLLALPMFNSALASALAALLATAACLPLAILAVRHPAWWAALFDRAAYAGQALPAITIALAFVFFTANYAPALYQTLALLVVAYAVRFLPQALGAVRGALLRVNPNTEDAARGLGASPLRTFRTVTVPQIMPGITAGAVLVFLTAVKELPITLLLSPIGFDTLATQIWSATSEAFFARAAPPSFVLLLVSALSVGLILRRERIG